MQLESYVTQVRDQLVATAALGDDRVRDVAAALAAAATPAVQLALMTALAEAADEITAALLETPGAPVVSIRVETDEVRVEVVNSASESPAAPPPDAGDTSARVSLRLSDALKAGIEAAAARDNVSVNTWLIRAATSSLTSAAGAFNHHGGHTHRVTGWVTG